VFRCAILLASVLLVGTTLWMVCVMAKS
jgi:hypothetical protein